MKIQLVAVGTKMPDWVQKGYNEYAKRLPKDLAPNLVELASGHRAKNAPIHGAVSAEGQAILAAVGPADWVIALDVVGDSWTTEAFAKQLANFRMDGRNLAFVIGGPDGLAPEVLSRANVKWSLSKLTLPHPLVRVLFIEQLYRAWTLLNGHPYHK
jgi:23S rRNA (pseudouridine1915-N3)-methyltransferase